MMDDGTFLCDSCGGKLINSSTFECTQISSSAEDNTVDNEKSAETELGENRYLIIESIPCFLCTQCGEKSFSPDVISSLEEMRARNHPTLGQRVKIVKFD